jgi:hypothetical protein
MAYANQVPVVVWARGFREDVGGIIVLHFLCHTLRQLGYASFLWPANKPRISWREVTIQVAVRQVKYWGSVLLGRFACGPGFDTPIASSTRARNSITVYPEVVDGNPLHSARVVRWLLHRPGFHTGRINFGVDELTFYYGEEFNAPHLPADRKLRLVWIMDQIFHQTSFGARTGSCYMVRKGKRRFTSPPEPGSILVDGKSNKDIATILNSVRIFYCYDLHTMFCEYAALCGCVPVVVPEKGVNKYEWRQDEEMRFGIAYGVEEIDWALATRDKLFRRLERERQSGAMMVERFVRVCEERFGCAVERL